MAEFDWNEKAIFKLRQLWAEGLSTAEIGSRMNISKNAVVGKAHRLDLPPRPSPIRRAEGADAAPRAPRVLTSSQSAANAAAMLPVAQAGATVRQPAIAPQRAKQCCFPFGDPRRPDFRYCDAPVYSAGVYCDDHAAICFVRVCDRREMVA